MNIKVSEIIEKIEGKIVTENVNIDEMTVSDGYVSDLLSDVMGKCQRQYDLGYYHETHECNCRCISYRS